MRLKYRLAAMVLLIAGAAALAGVSGCTGPAPSPPQATAGNGAGKLEWFGWSHFRITTAKDMVILINPFITGNPDASVTLEDIKRADYILVADGHGDELGDTIGIAMKTGARVVTGGFELGSWLMQKGVPAAQVIRSNPGNFHDLGGGVVVRVVKSVHGSGLPQPTIENPYGGPAAGFFVTLENGYTVYFAGSSAATMDMQLWAAAFKPDLAILPINANRDPVDVSHMVRLLSTQNPNLKKVIPHHQRVQPPSGATTVDQMAEAVRSVDSSIAVLRLQRGEVVALARETPNY